MRAYRHDVTVLRGTSTAGAYGGTDTDWSNPSRRTYKGNVQPLSATEDVAGQQRTESRWRAHLPAHADVLATDRIRWDDGAGARDYEVDGNVQRWRGHHIELVLTRVTQD